MGLALIGDLAAVALVIGLSLSGLPAAVPWLVVAIHIDPLNGEVGARRMANVRHQGLDAGVEELNPSAAIVRPALVVGVLAPFLGGAEGGVGLCMAQAMSGLSLGQQLGLEAATALCVALAQVVGEACGFPAAVAEAAPQDLPLLASAGLAQDNEAAITLAGAVNQSSSHGI